MIVVCETVAAIVPHFRRIADASEIRLSGHWPRVQTLCGRDAGWDTQLPLSAAGCRECLLEAFTDRAVVRAVLDLRAKGYRV